MSMNAEISEVYYTGVVKINVRPESEAEFAYRLDQELKAVRDEMLQLFRESQ